MRRRKPVTAEAMDAARREVEEEHDVILIHPDGWYAPISQVHAEEVDEFVLQAMREREGALVNALAARVAAGRAKTAPATAVAATAVKKTRHQRNMLKGKDLDAKVAELWEGRSLREIVSVLAELGYGVNRDSIAESGKRQGLQPRPRGRPAKRVAGP